jgi:cell division protein FtsL
MKLVALLLFIMIVLTLINGLVFMKKLIKLQQENNQLLKKISENKTSEHKNEKCANASYGVREI